LSIRPIVINDWRIYAHPLFLDQFETLLTRVEGLRQQDPRTYQLKKSTKLLAAIVKIAFAEIPQDPTQSKYRQGKTLGDDYKHWFRAKFFQQYRLFFRYHLQSKIIVYAWVNDDNSKRAYGSKTDAYSVNKKCFACAFHTIELAKEQTSWNSGLNAVTIARANRLMPTSELNISKH
jgi:toxin YhaV